MMMMMMLQILVLVLVLFQILVLVLMLFQIFVRPLDYPLLQFFEEPFTLYGGPDMRIVWMRKVWISDMNCCLHQGGTHVCGW